MDPDLTKGWVGFQELVKSEDQIPAWQENQHSSWDVQRLDVVQHSLQNESESKATTTAETTDMYTSLQTRRSEHQILIHSMKIFRSENTNST